MGIKLSIPVEYTSFSVPIAGGLAAQIYGAAAVFYLRLLGKTVNVDLSYFNHAPRFAPENAPGVPSIWSWELDKVGIKKVELLNTKNFERDNANTPSLEWLSLVSSVALQDNRILTKFNIPTLEQIEGDLKLSVDLSRPYVAVHLRRGDYLNCASFIVPSAASLDCGYRAGRYCRQLLVVSDSTIDITEVNTLREYFEAVDIIDNPRLSPTTLWGLLVNASVLVTGNSQFSISAGYFSKGVVFAPDKFFSDDLKYQNTLYRKQTPFFFYKSDV